MVINEYKLWMYDNYFLPSKRFLLTIHNLTQTQLKSLDTLTDKAIKRWAGVPRSATNVMLHMKEGLNIKSISQLYTETHTVSHVRTRTKGDVGVNNAINCTLEREGEWTTKKSTTVECEASYKDALNQCAPGGEAPIFTGEQAGQFQHKFNTNVTKQAKASLITKHTKESHEKVKSLVVQGKNLALAAAEEGDLIWKSYLYDLKAGTMKFLLNASIDTLPTAANLKRWKKSSSDKCKLCKNRQTTNHCLNICKISLDSGRFTWRHNNVINYIVQSLDTSKYTIHSDIPGHEAPGGGTVPPELTITPLKPDITIWDKNTDNFHIFELTCPLEENVEKRNLEKSNKYAHFITDISTAKTTVNAFEVSSRGYLSPRNHKTLKELHKFCRPNIKLSTFKQNISSLSLYSSYHIWLCRNDMNFVEPPYLQATFRDKQAV